jgi:hypothetical protein
MAEEQKNNIVIEVMDRVLGFVLELIDNDTLIIVGMSILAFTSYDHRELIAGALLGYMGAKIKEKPPVV